MSETKNYKLYVTDNEEEDTFTWVQKMDGENENSNIQKIDKILGEKSNHSKSIEAILAVDEWSENSPYSQTLQIDEITSYEQNGVLSLAQNITKEQVEAFASAGLYITNQAEGTLTISAIGDKPTCDIPVLIILLDPITSIFQTQEKIEKSTYIVNAPIGAIMIWSGTEDTVPQGWSICNGENGTLDLRDKFVLGAGEAHSVGDTGGSEEVTLTVEQIPPYYTAPYIQKTGITPSDYATEERVQEIVEEALSDVGTGLPPGGTTGQVLAKASDEDGDVEWKDVGGVTMEEVNTAINTAITGVVEGVY